jgi:hypothetical protein
MAIRHPGYGTMILRVPADVRAWIEKESLRSTAPMSSEIIRSIRERMERQAAEAKREARAE